MKKVFDFVIEKFKPLKIGTPSFYADAILWNWIKPEWFKLKYDPKKVFVGDILDD